MKTLGLTLILAALTGCTTLPTKEKPSELIGIADNYIAAWNAHDAQRVASFFTDDVEYYDASIGEAAHGRDSARVKIVEAFLKAAPDLVWQRDTVDPIVGRDAVAFEWRFSGTNTGDWSDGTKATGKKFSIHGTTLIRFRHGKIANQGDYYDAYGFLKQIGLVQQLIARRWQAGAELGVAHLAAGAADPTTRREAGESGQQREQCHPCADLVRFPEGDEAGAGYGGADVENPADFLGTFLVFVQPFLAVAVDH